MTEGARRVAAVTGASRGIGAAIALELARRGWTVGRLTRKGAGIETAATPPELAPRMVDLACDVLEEASIRDALAALAGKAGRIDALVNNAGLYLQGRTTAFATADFERVMDTNARACFVASREAFPHLERTRGTIVNLGSFFDKLGVKNNLAYCASKAAIGAITRCLAVEWASTGIRVLNVAPGYVETELNAEAMRKSSLRDFLAARVPTGGPGTREDVARLVAMLLGEELPFLTGETIYMDGGQGMAH